MRCFRLAITAAVTAAVIASAAANAARTDSRGGGAAATMSCGTMNVSATSSAVVLSKPACKVGGKTVRYYVTWARRFADASGSICTGFAAPKGSGLVAALPAKPALSYDGSMWPGLTSVTFTVKAALAGKTYQMAKTYTRAVPDSHVLCGGPVNLVSQPGSDMPSCAWATSPTIQGLVVRLGSISCAGGDGNCKWSRLPPLPQAGVLTMSNYQISCTAGGNTYNVWPVILIDYGTTLGTADCENVVLRESSYVVPSTWGPGGIDIQVKLANLNNPTKYPSGSVWDSGWFPAKGTANACTSELR